MSTTATRPADGWVVYYNSGNVSSVVGKKPEVYPGGAIGKVEPFFIGRPAVLPPTASMLPHIKQCYAEAFVHGKSDKTWRATEATQRKLAAIGADAYIKRLGLTDDAAAVRREIDYVAAAEQLAFSIHGTTINQLSAEEAENCRRYARAALHAGLSIP